MRVCGLLLLLVRKWRGRFGLIVTNVAWLVAQVFSEGFGGEGVKWQQQQQQLVHKLIFDREKKQKPMADKL
jgi:hypothetical protein